MRAVQNRLMVALAVGLLALASAGLVAADDKAGETMSLVGCLDKDVGGAFTLIERESGDRVAIEGSTKDIRLDDHVGHTVKVTGEWVEEESQYLRYFKVSAIDSLSESCQP